MQIKHGLQAQHRRYILKGDEAGRDAFPVLFKIKWAERSTNRID